VTINAWSGVGLARGSHEQILEEATRSGFAVERWRTAHCLIIDEVSMLSGALLEALDAIGRKARGLSSAAFGGLQLICCGDFLQLPPVQGSFAFEASAWKQARLASCCLKVVVRQSGDAPFTSLLNEVRQGRCSAATAAALAACHESSKPLPQDGILPTRLYCTNVDVDAENAGKLAQLPGETMHFLGKDFVKKAPSSSAGTKAMYDTINRQAPECLGLKLHAQVILTRNMNDRLVNGSRGIVTALSKADGPTVRFDCDEIMTVKPVAFDAVTQDYSCTRTQVPLKLAW
jgi:ATP-dependent DNA helicase PIF1